MIGAFIPWAEKGSNRGHPGYLIAENGCHIWIGATSFGYGRTRDENGRHARVHRLRYLREVGPIPEGMVLDHYVCDNRACCNPLHVRPVSQRENLLRSDLTMAARNRAKTHCPKGHELSKENLYTSPRGRGCLMCRRAVSAKWNARVRAASMATRLSVGG